MSFTSQKGMDLKVRLGIFMLMVLGALSHDLLIRSLATVLITCFATLEWHRLEMEKQEYRKHCEV